VLRADEERQDLAEGPAGTALLLGPGVVVLRTTAREHLRIDRTAATEHPPLRIDDAVPGGAAGHRFITPGERPGGNLEKADRHVDVTVGIARAGLEQQHRHVRILAQPGGHDASGGTATDNDVVGHFSLPSTCRGDGVLGPATAIRRRRLPGSQRTHAMLAHDRACRAHQSADYALSREQSYRSTTALRLSGPPAAPPRRADWPRRQPRPGAHRYRPRRHRYSP